MYPKKYNENERPAVYKATCNNCNHTDFIVKFRTNKERCPKCQSKDSESFEVKREKTKEELQREVFLKLYGSQY